MTGVLASTRPGDSGPCCPIFSHPTIPGRTAMNWCGGSDPLTGQQYTDTGCGIGPRESDPGPSITEQRAGEHQKLSRLWCCEWGILTGTP